MSGRREDPALLRGDRHFVADLPFDGLHACFVRSPLAHGVIESVEVDEARRAPGVVAVETAQSLALTPFVHFPAFRPDCSRSPLAHGRVRHVGEAIAVVVADTPTHAADAAELVDVDLAWLPPVVDVGDPDAAPLYEGTDGNRVLTIAPEGDEDPLADAAVIAEVTVIDQRVSSAPLEPDGIVVSPDVDGRLDVWCTSQGVHDYRRELAAALSLPESALRVRSPAVGGGFGGRASVPVEFIVVAELARRLGQPVRYVQTRTDALTGMVHGRGVTTRVRLGADAAGTLVGMDVEAVADAGAASHMGPLLLASTKRQLTGLYRIPALRFRAEAWLTTTTPVGAYRGAGQPEANHARERAIDVLARRLGRDPVEIRLANLLAQHELPAAQPGGVVYDVGDPGAALRRCLALGEFDRWRTEQTRRRAAGERRRIGVGVACYAQTTGRALPADGAVVTLTPDGRALVACGSASHGQSHADTWRGIVEQRLGISADAVDVIDADTDVIADGLSVGGSRATQILGSALDHACADLVDQARLAAADLLEVAPTDLVVSPAGFGLGPGLSVAGVPTRRVTWAALAASQGAGAAGAHGDPALAVAPDDPGPAANACLRAARHEATEGEAHPYGAHLTVVEVDPDTGGVRVLAHTAVDDCGVVLQPAYVEGQQHGGSVAGISQVLWEDAGFDRDGMPLGATFATYLLPGAADLPMITTTTQSIPTARNRLGTKGIGENGCNGALASAHNAVLDALADLGIEHLDLPLSPERIWRAVATAERARSGATDPAAPQPTSDHAPAATGQTAPRRHPPPGR